MTASKFINFILDDSVAEKLNNAKLAHQEATGAPMKNPIIIRAAIKGFIKSVENGRGAEFLRLIEDGLK